jgi:RimJ/RimL family protein N-acetyltransferase
MLRRQMLEDAPWAFTATAEEDIGCDPERLAARIVEPGQAIVGAFDAKGRLVGAAGLVRNPKKKLSHRALVWGVYVTPSARGMGIAREVMNAIFDVARFWPGVTSLALCASERAEVAQRLYQSLGFKIWGIEPAAVEIGGHRYAEAHMVAFLDVP